MKRLTLQERVLLHEQLKVGKSSGEIAQGLGCSVATVRYWGRKVRHEGVDGLRSRMGRPIRGVMSRSPVWMKEQVLAWRRAHPGWGAKTLWAQLQPVCGADEAIPSRASLARLLQAEGMSRRYQRHSELPATAMSAGLAAHQHWQMDAQGAETVEGVGKIALINLNDVATRTKLLSFPCYLGWERVERHPTTADYQLALRLAFAQWGLPDRLQVDHESIFFDNQSPSPFPTRWHLWLIALGVEVVFSRVRCPTDQAITERSHQTWYRQVIQGQHFTSLNQLQTALDQRREFLNEHLPCASLNNQPALVAHPQARSPRRLFRPEWEPNLLQLSRVYDYLAAGHWYRTMSQTGSFTLGGHVYVAGITWARHPVDIRFDPTDAHLALHSGKADLSVRLPIKDLTTTALMGEMGSLANLDQFQLMLPFDWADQRVLILSETLGVRTF